MRKLTFVIVFLTVSAFSAPAQTTAILEGVFRLAKAGEETPMPPVLMNYFKIPNPEKILAREIVIKDRKTGKPRWIAGICQPPKASKKFIVVAEPLGRLFLTPSGNIVTTGGNNYWLLSPKGKLLQTCHARGGFALRPINDNEALPKYMEILADLLKWEESQKKKK